MFYRYTILCLAVAQRRTWSPFHWLSSFFTLSWAFSISRVGKSWDGLERDFKSRLGWRIFEAIMRKSAIVQTEQTATGLRDQEYRSLRTRRMDQSTSEKLSRTEIRAPVSSIVYGLAVFAPRSVIRPADLVLFLIPQDRSLIIAARVEPVHIYEIFTGQEVVLRLSSRDQCTTPELMSRVVQISAYSFQDQSHNYPIIELKLSLARDNKKKFHIE
jgi:hypothetical protein